jgi:hypothetical protein
MIMQTNKHTPILVCIKFGQPLKSLIFCANQILPFLPENQQLCKVGQDILILQLLLPTFFCFAFFLFACLLVGEEEAGGRRKESDS